MEIKRERALQLIAELWADDYRLTRQYFGKYLSQLLVALIEGEKFDEHFVNCTFEPDNLEKRLRKIEYLGQTKSIVAEVGDISDPDILDKRLSNVWAEIRVIDQLLREGFSDIQKVRETSDFIAQLQGQNYAIQVVRINSSLESKAAKNQTYSDISPYGSISSIHSRLDSIVSEYFWNALDVKNGKFKSWKKENYVRCIIIVSSDENLQDSMVRHIACQQIRNNIHLLMNRYFEELVWLPDLSDGAWFKVGSTLDETRCLVNWKDELGQDSEKDDKVIRHQVDLDSLIGL